jgi:predicted restriction endonuclease
MATEVGEVMRFPKDPPIKNPALFKIMHSEIHQCELCGSAEFLEVAHIKGRKMGGGFRKDTPENLIMLCRACHQKYDSATRLERMGLAISFLIVMQNRPEWLNQTMEASCQQ